jgi:hypothetical protein
LVLINQYSTGLFVSHSTHGKTQLHKNTLHLMCDLRCAFSREIEPDKVIFPDPVRTSEVPHPQHPGPRVLTRLP